LVWKPRKKRVLGSEITYKGKVYPSIVALQRAWVGDKPSERTLPAKLLKWRKDHPNEPLTDLIIEEIFKTRSGQNRITFDGQSYSGPRDLYDSFSEEKITYGGFWARLNEHKKAAQPGELTDKLIKQLLSPEVGINYKGNSYPSLAQLYKALKFEKIVLHRFIGNLNEWKSLNPKLVITDEVIEKNAKFYGGDYEFEFKGATYPNLKSLYDAQPSPKCKLATFTLRVKKLKQLRTISVEDIENLLKENTKVAFFKGILYRWTHKTSGKIYIGISSMPLKERVRIHLRQAKSGTYGNPLSLQAAIVKDGVEAFNIDVIGEYDDEKEMLLAEDRAIKKYNSIAPNGFNLRDGGLGWTKQGTDVEYDGVVYPSYSVLAKQFGLSEKLLDGRRRWGWSLKDALTTPLYTKNASAKPVIVNGEAFLTLSKAAKKFNVDYKKVHERLSRGWTIEDALELTTKINQTRKTVIVNGQTFETISAAARHYKKDPKKVWGALDRGQSIEKALGLEG
jgi:group I intron endonuclease